MLDPAIAAHLGPPAAIPPLTEALLPAIRMQMAMAGRALPGADMADVSDHDADGVQVRLYHADADEAQPLLVFLHGGGWMLGDLDTHDAMARHLAIAGRCAVLAVGYRLAPEHPFPGGLEDCGAALAWVRRNAVRLGLDAGRIALGGESAGANLAAALTLRLRDTGGSQPLFQLLIHPATDMAFAFPAFDQVVVAGLDRGFLKVCRDFYLGGSGDPTDPLVSPLRAASHAGLAPAIVLTAEEDPLRDDGEFYAAALVRSGVETLAARLPGLPHGFLFLPVTIPAVAASYRLIGRLLVRYFAAD